ncbi:MAG TPA: chemotaxis protein CheW [Burkholderiaceae bacterium]
MPATATPPPDALVAGPAAGAVPIAQPNAEYLSFGLGAEEYGVDILRVQEICRYGAVTRIPDAPDFVKGVVNLRGVIVPVFDLRLKLRLAAAPYDDFTVMIVLKLAGRVTGIVVDRVSDVVALQPAQIFPAPPIGPDGDMAFVTGLAALGDRMLILVDIERLLGDDGFAPLPGDPHASHVSQESLS